MLALPDTKLRKRFDEQPPRSRCRHAHDDARGTERMAEGIVRLRAEILRRREPDGEARRGRADVAAGSWRCARWCALRARSGSGALAEALGVTVATASRTVDALAARGLVQRDERPGGRPRRAGRCDRRRAAASSGCGATAFRARARAAACEELSEDERRQLADSLETRSAACCASCSPSGDRHDRC